VFRELVACADKYRYSQLRITGNEPTIGKEHLLNLLAMIENTNLQYILESNGILIGNDPDFAEQLARFTHVHVRISLKGTDEEEFSRLTGASSNSFDLQIRALENLMTFGVPCNPAVMVSFSSQKGLEKLKEKLARIDGSLVNRLEKEYVILYPPVVERLKKSRITPLCIHPHAHSRPNSLR
jgi:uncharacterized Fe-S cluster-containing radical SAM superfamily protein